MVFLFCKRQSTESFCACNKYCCKLKRFYIMNYEILFLLKFVFFFSSKHLEMLIRDGSIWPCNIVQSSRFVRTLMFMGLSGIILDSINMDMGSAFWLFHPVKSRNGIENRYLHDMIQNKESTYLLNFMEKSSACQHKTNCFVHNKKVNTNGTNDNDTQLYFMFYFVI